MNGQSTRNKAACNLAILLGALSSGGIFASEPPEMPLLVVNPHLALSPSHRRNALDSNGGASLGAQSNFSNARSRPQTYGITANMPFIRDVHNEQSGWGLGLGAFFSTANASSFLRTYETQTFELSFGRSTIVPSLAESVGLQGFFETGFTHMNTNPDAPEGAPAARINRTRRSLFVRFGAMSLRGGQGIVSYKPFAVDQSFVSALSFPIDFGETIFSFTHTAQLRCFWAQLKCGTVLSYTRYSELQTSPGFEEPVHWLTYGVGLSAYFFDRSAILRSRLVWDTIKTTAGEWNNGSGRPTFSTDIGLIF
ncbi:MAG TPA: hypothetical protein VM901_03035 [Bdellovibrionota bacterium]|nr:hypothetical protein [Bdellovibrionota bacterium]